MYYFELSFEAKVKVAVFSVCTDDGHLHFEVDPDCSSGQPRFWDRFPLLWSGCRLTHGVVQGRVGFEVRVERTLSTTRLEYKDDKCPHGLRVGWSMADSSLLLGEDVLPQNFCYLDMCSYSLIFFGLLPGKDELSFAYDGRGRKVSGGTEEVFGEPFTVGDIIGCYTVSHTLKCLSH